MAKDVPSPTIVAERVGAFLGDVNTRMKTTLDQTTRIGEELTDMARGNVEVLLASGQAIAEGADTLRRQAADYRGRRVERTAAAFSSFAAAKTPVEWVEIEGRYVQSSLDDAMAQASLWGDAWAKVARNAIQPVTDRYVDAAEKMLVVMTQR